jgi:hypothetical protein
MFRGAFVSMPAEWRAPVTDRRGHAGGALRPGPSTTADGKPLGGRRRTGGERPRRRRFRPTAIVVAVAAALLLATAITVLRTRRAASNASSPEAQRLLRGLPPGSLAVAFSTPPPPADASRSASSSSSSSSSSLPAATPIHDPALRAFVALCAAGRETYVVMDRHNGRALASRSIEALGVGCERRGGSNDASTTHPCPLADIMLAGADRSVGLCTDAAIYAWLLGARVLPLGTPLARYRAPGGWLGGNGTTTTGPCPHAPARLSLEPLYARWVLREEAGELQHQEGLGAEAFAREGGGMRTSGEGGGRGGARRGGRGRRSLARARTAGGIRNGRVQQQQQDEAQHDPSTSLPPPLPPLLPAAHNVPPRWWSPNPENQPAADRDLHARMDAVLCKTRACERMMLAYMRDLAEKVAGQGAAAAAAAAPLVLFAGHTSLDPVDAAAVTQTPLIARAPGVRPPPDLPPEEADEDEDEEDAREAEVVAALLAPAAIAADADATTTTATADKPPLLAAERPEPLRALHVRGKSGLKHTAELLACWFEKSRGEGGGGGSTPSTTTAPSWPMLDMVGPLPNPQVPESLARRYLAANVRLPLEQRAPGPAGGGSAAPQLASFASVAALQLRSAVHVCPSEREGFGHYVNEARAAGALVVASAHAPLDELVWEEEEEAASGADPHGRGPPTGVLIRPYDPTSAYFSQPGPPVPALARYAHMSVRLSPRDICAAVECALALAPEERARRGQAARRAFVEGRRALERRLGSFAGAGAAKNEVRAALERQVVDAVAEGVER